MELCIELKTKKKIWQKIRKKKFSSQNMILKFLKDIIIFLNF